NLGTGAYAFIPLPFLDDWLIKRQRRKMAQAVLESRGISYDRKAPRLIVEEDRPLFARLGSLMKGLVMKPLKKLFRTVLIWLTAKNAARTVMVSYFLARFLHHPALLPADAGRHLSEERARFLSTVFHEVSEDIDVRAAKDALQQLIKLFARSNKRSTQEIGETIEKAAPNFIAEFDALVSERLGSAS
ncbi:MAG: hypothetical protein ACQKBY_06265, partial [Verrucomicrobiales bacterium]